MKPLVILLLFLCSAIAIAAESAHGGHESHVPVKMIVLQLVNFGIFVGLLVYILKGKLKDFFHSRKEDFTAALRKAEEAKKQAEDHRRMIKERLNKLQSTADETIARAKREAEELRANILREAEELSRKIREEAERATKYEVERAKEELRQTLLSAAVLNARQVISKNIGAPDQQRLNNEFVQKIEVVSQ